MKIVAVRVYEIEIHDDELEFLEWSKSLEDWNPSEAVQNDQSPLEYAITLLTYDIDGGDFSTPSKEKEIDRVWGEDQGVKILWRG